MITNISQLDLSKQYSYADYLTWWFDERVELIKGYVKLMSPAPSNTHQKISIALSTEIALFLKKQICQIRYAPFDVRLKRTNNDHDAHIVVQPDICIICDPSLLDEKGCNGAPDMIIEILSLSNGKHDLITKYELYEEAGVQEYWIVFPYERIIEVYHLENKKYRLFKRFIEDDLIEVKTLPGLVIDMKDIFINN